MRRRRVGGQVCVADVSPSSVVVLGVLQGPQVPEAQPQALHVEAVPLPLLPLQQVFDTVGPLLLKGNQLLFNLSGGGDEASCYYVIYAITPACLV